MPQCHPHPRLGRKPNPLPPIAPRCSLRVGRATDRARPLSAGRDRSVTDRKINPGPPAQRFMKPPLSRYIALAQRRTIVLMSRRGPLLERVRRARGPVLDLTASGLGQYDIATLMARRTAIETLIGRLKYLPAVARATKVTEVET